LLLRCALFFGDRTGASLPRHAFIRFPLFVALTPRDAFLNTALLLGQPLRTALLLQPLSGLSLTFGLGSTLLDPGAAAGEGPSADASHTGRNWGHR
jgi:hypothetical protein